jgi:hypothetical protein
MTRLGKSVACLQSLASCQFDGRPIAATDGRERKWSVRLWARTRITIE